MGWLEIFQEDIHRGVESIDNNISKPSILIVDDEESIISTIEKYLSLKNYFIMTANSGLQALEIYKAQSPRIIITDIIMPGMNGLELLRTIRETDSDTEIIVLTGNGDIDAAIEALKNKASDFLVKPFDLEVLLHSVQKAESHLKLKDDIKSYTIELEELFKKVHHSREYLETIIQNSPNATITYDPQGIITSWNEAAEKITGYTKHEALGKTLKEIFVFDSCLIDISSGELGYVNRQNIVGQILTKQQKMRYISRNANILRDPETKVIGGIESFYDITEKTKSDRLLEKRYMQVQSINEIGKKVAASIDVSELMDFISKRLVTTFFESANIFFLLFSDTNDELILRAASGILIDDVLKKHPIGGIVDPSKDLIGRVIKEGVSGLYNAAYKCEDFYGGFSKDVQSVFAFPIFSHNKKYGVLYIENAEQMDLDDSDISMMETISEYLAISLDKIALMEKITNQNHLLEKQASDLKDALSKVEAQKEIIEGQNQTLLKDLYKAGEFQKSLLPDCLPEHENFAFKVSFTPSNQLGGDYYDVFRITDRYIGLLVADASGHGVSSAMLSAMFKMTLGKYAANDIDPSAVFKKLNHDFCQVLQMGDFFTAFYGIIDLKKNRFIYSNAAHPLPLMYNYKTNEILEFDSEGFLLGVMDNDITYEKKEFDLNGRYRLLIYTDGLPEAINEEKIQYGENRVQSDLIKYAQKSPQEYLDAIVRDLKSYTGADSFEDDLTLFVMDVSL